MGLLKKTQEVVGSARRQGALLARCVADVLEPQHHAVEARITAVETRVAEISAKIELALRKLNLVATRERHTRSCVEEIVETTGRCIEFVDALDGDMEDQATRIGLLSAAVRQLQGVLMDVGLLSESVDSEAAAEADAPIGPVEIPRSENKSPVQAGGIKSAVSYSNGIEDKRPSLLAGLCFVQPTGKKDVN